MAPKKATAGKTATKKATARKATPKKATAGKTATKKATARKATPKKATTRGAGSARRPDSARVRTSPIISDEATQAILRSIQVPDYSQLFKGVQFPDYSQLFKGVQLPDYSQLFKGVQLPDYSQLFKTIRVPDYAELVRSVAIPAATATLGSVALNYDQLVANIVLPDFRSIAGALSPLGVGAMNFRDLLPDMRAAILALGALVDQPVRGARSQAAALAPAIARLAGDLGRRVEEVVDRDPRPDAAGAGRRGSGDDGIGDSDDEPVTLGDLYSVMTEMLLALDAIQDGLSTGPSTLDVVNTMINAFVLLLTIAAVLIAL